MPNHSGESGLHPVDHDQDRQRSCQLEDLDDACLINIFSRLTPLPDLFSVSRSCRRFRELTTDGRMWLLVSTEVGPGRRLSASGRHCRCMFPTLHEAVAASRPGDTIIIEPGETHIAQDVAIPWPLQLLGGGSMPESTVLTCPKGADAAALDFRATAKLANLTIACAAQPGATTASSVAGGHINASVEAPPVEACDGPVLVVPALAVRQFASVGGPQGAEPAVGVLSVVETKIRGGRGSLAVRCCGTGQLQSVRIINLMKDTLYWFDVDSSSPGYVGVG
ncbi:hypothetical protein WJX72_009933 [[Myrmecia] bisecta]|uniref:F-box domain-containing protein n=1 Tax=[Myrmecia] bisecta TaxID=41462 RepID=A0AAW1PXN0_9CHLO